LYDSMRNVSCFTQPNIVKRVSFYNVELSKISFDNLELRDGARD